MVDAIAIARNSRKVRFDPLFEKYVGRHIAWSHDDTEVLAAAATCEESIAELRRRGAKDYVFDFVSEHFAPPPLHLKDGRVIVYGREHRG